MPPGGWDTCSRMPPGGWDTCIRMPPGGWDTCITGYRNSRPHGQHYSGGIPASYFTLYFNITQVTTINSPLPRPLQLNTGHYNPNKLAPFLDHDN